MKNITLNEDQSDALKKLTAFLDDDTQMMSLLEGPAGSGKSTLISSLIDSVMESSILGKIAIVSPTNKALKVVKQMIAPIHKDRIQFSTLHSLLGLKYKISHDGKEVFEKDSKSMCKLPFFELVIVDETSMVADELFHQLNDQNNNQTKIIFVGDSNQINPVNHIHSIPMMEDNRELYNILHVKLTKIVRQAENNPIIKYSQQVLKDTFTFSAGTKDITENTGVVMLSQSQSDVLIPLLKHYFCSEDFDKNANYCKLLAWRNATVDSFNTIIRNLKYGKGTHKIVIGEKLIADRPIKNNSEEIVFATNEDLEVLSLDIQTKKLYNVDYKFYNCKVQGDDLATNIHILHESCLGIYNKTLKLLADDAKNEKDIGKRVAKWKAYYGMIENFSAVKYNYAITVHNSQGSTYDNAIVVNTDINFNQRDDERKRILYTALTRSKNMLYII